MSPRASRRLLLGSLGATALAGVALRLCREDGRTPRSADAPGRKGAPPDGARGQISGVLPERAREALEALQARMLPSIEGSPSAAAVGAGPYLERLIARDVMDPSVKRRLLGGLARLDELAVRRGARRFAALPAPEQDAVVQEVYGESSDGQEFYDATLDFTLEAFLGAPAHGGNPEGMVWAWLGLPLEGVAPGGPR
jgi:hypothetical protein